MKKLTTFIFCLCFLLSACSSAPKSKAEPASSPMKSAKTFVQALTTGDEALLNTVIYHSQSMPAGEIMNIAKMRKITGMKTSNFKYTQDPKDKDTVMVSFKASEGQQDKWRLVFVKNDNDNGKYQYDGFLSGTLLANSTLEITTKSYLKALIKSNSFYLENISNDRIVGGYDHFGDRQFAQKYGINKLKVTDFEISPDGQLGDEDQLKVIFKDKEGKKRGMEVQLTKQVDGFYYFGSYTMFYDDSLSGY